MDYYSKAPQKKRRRGKYFKCETCGDEFYVMPSHVKKSVENGTRIRFCSMKCYVRTGDKNPFWGRRHSAESVKKMVAHPDRPRFLAGDLNPNFVKYGAEFGFRGSRARWWREHLLKEIGKCEECGFSDKRILTLHHVDRDRSNNVRENVKLLCWNCHATDHFEAKDGAYHFFNNDR